MANETDAQGRKQGKWITEVMNYRSEGDYKDDKQHGYWIIRHDDGTIEEGQYYEGKRKGEWTLTDPDSRRIERHKYEL